MTMLQQLQSELHALKNEAKAKHLQGFFKTGKGDYAEGDMMLGISAPEQRKIAKKYQDIALKHIENLLQSRWHEERLTALLILILQYKKGETDHQENIYNLYLNNTKQINNWDLVDTSAEFIVGPWLANKDKTILIQLAHSSLIWERRIAMLSTFCYIKKGDAVWALKIAEILLEDPEDLIQKAVGWMLREIGKRCSIQQEENFLALHYQKMPRTMLRYAIERFDDPKRLAWLQKK